DAQQLTPAEVRLFETPLGALLFEAGAASEQLGGTLVPTTSHYRADAVVRVLATRRELRQSVSIRCQPEGATLPSLLVRLSPAPRGPVTWRISGEESREVQATAMGETPQSKVLSDEAIYRLTMQRPRSTAFEVLGDWSA